ncbi:MAG: hypothetical protein INQ03_11770 [Candidatus Heimdallarchaeota archaeon]|nr:hypothetical protein [Candidatus Heimdallarchaeota archaeon]
MNLMKPNVSMKAKNPKMALYGHILSLIGSLVAVILAIIALLGGNFLGIIGMLAAILIFVVEGDFFEIPFLKDAMVRGIVWVLLAVIAGAGGLLTGLVIIIGGILYIIYSL